MKSLNDFVIGKEIEQYLYNEILESINEWWYLQMTHFGNLSNHQLLCERFGEFDNVRAVMKRIMEYIDYVYKYEEDIRVKNPNDPKTWNQSYYDKEVDKVVDCSDIKNVYFKKVIIDIKETNKDIGGRYVSFKNGIVTIEISINDSVKRWRDFVSYTILHELIHGYVDYNLQTKGTTLNKLMTKKYSAVVGKLKRNDIFRNIRNCIYFLDPHERNAYIGTLRTTIEKVCKKLDVDWRNLKFEEILDALKNEYIWNVYIDINTFLNSFDLYSESQQRLIEYIYEKELKEKRTFHKIHKELLKEYKKFKKQFMRTFANSYCDYVQDHIGLSPGWSKDTFDKLNEGYYFI